MNQREDPVSFYFKFFNEIGIIAQLSGNKLERVLPEGMSLAQFTVLNHFCRLGGAWSVRPVCARRVRSWPGLRTSFRWQT